MRSCLIVIAFIFLSSAASAQLSLHRGENLLQPMPIPGEGWEISSKIDDESRSIRWSHSVSGAHLTTSIYSDGRASTTRFREINDDTGKDHCRQFESKTILTGETNGYSREIWLAECGMDSGKGFTLLHQVIAGKDSTYYLVKRWPETPGDHDLKPWVDYFETVSVCDTRKRRKAPCPTLSEIDEAQ